MTKEISVRQQASMNRWALVIREQRASGKTVRDFCREHGLSCHAYYYWLRKIRQVLLDNNQQADMHTFAEVPCPDPYVHSFDEGSIIMHIGTASLELKGNVNSYSLRTAMQLLKELDL